MARRSKIALEVERRKAAEQQVSDLEGRLRYFEAALRHEKQSAKLANEKSLEIFVEATTLGNIAWSGLYELLNDELSKCDSVEPSAIAEAQTLLRFKEAIARGSARIVVNILRPAQGAD